MPEVLVGIATYKRPRMLEAALRQLAAIETAASVRVLVADNSEAGEGIDVVTRLAAQGYRFPIASQLVTARGIPQVRNAIVAAALADPGIEFLAFMDDDQLPEPAWLDALLAMHRQTGAEVVGSTVIPRFEVEPPKWIVETRAFRRDETTDGPVKIIHGTGGVLIATGLLRTTAQPWFDAGFALTGGEDSEFFQRLQATGVRFARAGRSVIHEVFGSTRLTLGWLLRRAYRVGAADLRIARRLRPGWRTQATEIARIGGALLLSPPLLVAFFGQPSRQADTLCRLARAFGKITAFFGWGYDEYAIIHGQ